MNARYEAWIQIPKRAGSFELTHKTNDRQEAFHWLAGQVADHPASTWYGIMDRVFNVLVHQAGVVEAEIQAQVEARA